MVVVLRVDRVEGYCAYREEWAAERSLMFDQLEVYQRVKMEEHNQEKISMSERERCG